MTSSSRSIAENGVNATHGDQTGAAGPSGFDARSQQEFLADALNDRRPGNPHTDTAWGRHTWDAAVASLQASGLFAGLRNRRSSLAKTAVALLAALVLVWTPLQRLMTTTSAQAVVNARIFTVRASIDGRVTARLPALGIGAHVEAGAAILEIENRLADRSTLSALQHRRSELATTISILEARQRSLATRIRAHTVQMDVFQTGRIAQLETRVRAVVADLEAAKKNHETTAGVLRRTRALNGKGIVSPARLEASIGDEGSAIHLIERLSQQKEGLLVELAALRAGVFIGDSYNDIPQSAQRRNEDELQLIEIDARLAGTKTEVADLENLIAAETRRHAMLASATLRSEVSGRIWEVLVAPGEFVTRGQDLLRLIDCANSTVTAAVSETVYQQLSIGHRAQFRPRTGESLPDGWIIGLSGLANVSSNYAISQSALSKEPYKVTLRFPGLDRPANCLVGRSGLVTFDTTSRVDIGKSATTATP